MTDFWARIPYGNFCLLLSSVTKTKVSLKFRFHLLTEVDLLRGWCQEPAMVTVVNNKADVLKSAAALAVNCNAAKGRWCSEYSDWFNTMHEK